MMSFISGEHGRISSKMANSEFYNEFEKQNLAVSGKTDFPEDAGNQSLLDRMSSRKDDHTLLQDRRGMTTKCSRASGSADDLKAKDLSPSPSKNSVLSIREKVQDELLISKPVVAERIIARLRLSAEARQMCKASEDKQGRIPLKVILSILSQQVPSQQDVPASSVPAEDVQELLDSICQRQRNSESYFKQFKLKTKGLLNKQDVREVLEGVFEQVASERARAMGLNGTTPASTTSTETLITQPLGIVANSLSTEQMEQLSNSVIPPFDSEHTREKEAGTRHSTVIDRASNLSRQASPDGFAIPKEMAKPEMPNNHENIAGGASALRVGTTENNAGQPLEQTPKVVSERAPILRQIGDALVNLLPEDLLQFHSEIEGNVFVTSVDVDSIPSENNQNNLGQDLNPLLREEGLNSASLTRKASSQNLNNSEGNVSTGTNLPSGRAEKGAGALITPSGRTGIQDNVFEPVKNVNVTYIGDAAIPGRSETGNAWALSSQLAMAPIESAEGSVANASETNDAYLEVNQALAGEGVSAPDALKGGAPTGFTGSGSQTEDDGTADSDWPFRNGGLLGGSKETTRAEFDIMGAIHNRFEATASSREYRGGDIGNLMSNPPILEDISNKIQELYRRRRSELTLELEPKELGRMVLRVEAARNQVNAWISAENEHTRHLLLQNTDALKQHLQENGLTLGQLHVGLKQEQPGNQQQFQRNQASGIGAGRGNSIRGREPAESASLRPLYQARSGQQLISIFA